MTAAGQKIAKGGKIKRKDEGVRSKYNRWYEKIKKEEMPAYLRKEWREGRWRRIIRFRMNNEMRGARIGKQRRGGCVSCAGGEETWEHMLVESMGGKKDGNWWESLREILGQEGEREWWLKELEEKREKEEGG